MADILAFSKSPQIDPFNLPLLDEAKIIDYCNRHPERMEAMSKRLELAARTALLLFDALREISKDIR